MLFSFLFSIPVVFLLFLSVVFFSSVLFFLLVSIAAFETFVNSIDLYSFDIFYIHVSSSIFCQLFFWLVFLISLFFLGGFVSFYFFLVRQSLLFSCLVSCSISIISGEFWSISTWGTWAPFDSRFVSLLVLFLTYIILYYIVQLGIYNGFKNYIFISNWFCIFMSFMYPFIKYSVTWWNSLHMSSSFNVYSDLSLEQNYDLFFCFLFYFVLFYFLLLICHLWCSLLSLKFVKYFID